VAIGCGGFVVGALFWPHGASWALGQALAEAFRDNAHHLRSAIAFGLTRCDALHTEPRVSPCTQVVMTRAERPC
jgi:hypothetical protein